jgi:hypothetical protein
VLESAAAGGAVWHQHLLQVVELIQGHDVGRLAGGRILKIFDSFKLIILTIHFTPIKTTVHIEFPAPALLMIKASYLHPT